MKKILLAIAFINVSAFSQSLPAIPSVFSNPTDCSQKLSAYYYQYGDQMSDNNNSWLYYFMTTNSSMQNSKTCSNGTCTYQWWFNFSSTLFPSDGGCDFVNTVYWPQMLAQINTINSNGSPQPYTYGVYCSNTTGKVPPSNFGTPDCTLQAKQRS